MRACRCWLVALVAVGSAALADEKPLRRIAFASCAHQDKPLPIFEKIVAAQPELYLALGDNIYADTTDPAVMKAKYDKMKALPGYQKLRQTCPILATWDDHDYGGNDAGASYPKKVESQQLFFDFFDEPKDSPRRKQQGVYHARVLGPAGKRVQVILLDCRYFLGPLKKKAKFLPAEGGYEPNNDPSVPLLGEKQWAWLAEQLKVPAELRLLVSSIQVVAEDHGHEKWMNLPHERERLYQLLRTTKAAGVVILSGDRHLAELSLTDAGLGYPLYDLTSSGLNQATHYWRKLEVNRHRVATMNQGDNFGMILIDWDRPEPRLTLQIRDDEGDVTIQQKLALKTLRPGATAVKKSGPARLSTGQLLTAAEVAKWVNKDVTLEMNVVATGRSTSLVFLNSAEDRRDDNNFTVVLDKAAQEKLTQAGVADPQAHYRNKRVRVVGKLTLFRERAQVIVSDPALITILEQDGE